MNFRVRYHLSLLPLFLGLTLAAATLAYVVESRQVTWALTQEVETNAICLAAFLKATKPDAVAPDWPWRKLIAERLSNAAGGLTVAWFEPDGVRWRPRLLCETSGLNPPTAPDREAIERLRAGEAAARLFSRAGTDYDETVGYAGVYDETGALRSVVALTARDTTTRPQRQAFWRAAAWLGLTAIVGSLLVAEVLTRRARRDLAALTRGAEALVRGDHAHVWGSSITDELDDLSHTLAAIGRILQDTAWQARRRFLRSGHQPGDEEVAGFCHRAASGEDQLTPESARRCVVRRIRGGEPDDFWAVQRGKDCWHVLAGRLELPPAPMSAVQRSVRAEAARDYLCGLLKAGAVADPCSEVDTVFKLNRFILVTVPDADGELAVTRHGNALKTVEAVMPSGRKPSPSARAAVRDERVVVLGTLEPRVLTIAAEYLRHSSPGSAARAADELATVFAAKDRGLLLIFSLS